VAFGVSLRKAEVTRLSFEGRGNSKEKRFFM